MVIREGSGIMSVAPSQLRPGAKVVGISSVVHHRSNLSRPAVLPSEVTGHMRRRGRKHRVLPSYRDLVPLGGRLQAGLLLRPGLRRLGYQEAENRTTRLPNAASSSRHRLTIHSRAGKHTGVRAEAISADQHPGALRRVEAAVEGLAVAEVVTPGAESALLIRDGYPPKPFVSFLKTGVYPRKLSSN